MRKINYDVDYLWQRPKRNILDVNHKWYDKAPVGRDPLNDAMKNLSINAGLSKTYTNHSIRATVVTNLDRAGFEARHIMATTGHKSETSIKNYSRICPTNKRRDMSETLSRTLVGEPLPKVPKIVPSTSASDKSSDVCDLGNAELQTINRQDMKEIFDVDMDSFIESKDVLDFVTQVEKENTEVATNQNESAKNNAVVPAQGENSTDNSKTININQVAHVNRHPLMPHMLFPHSNVTINYNIINK